MVAGLPPPAAAGWGAAPGSPSPAAAAQAPLEPPAAAFAPARAEGGLEDGEGAEERERLRAREEAVAAMLDLNRRMLQRLGEGGGVVGMHDDHSSGTMYDDHSSGR